MLRDAGKKKKKNSIFIIYLLGGQCRRWMRLLYIILYVMCTTASIRNTRLNTLMEVHLSWARALDVYYSTCTARLKYTAGTKNNNNNCHVPVYTYINIIRVTDEKCAVRAWADDGLRAYRRERYRLKSIGRTQNIIYIRYTYIGIYTILSSLIDIYIFLKWTAVK